VRKAIVAVPGRTTKEIASALGLSYTQVRNSLKVLARQDYTCATQHRYYPAAASQAAL
jgi:predicted ArsR family transcriptional regulator